MSIELKQAAEKALVVLGSATSFMSRKARDQHESVVAELSAAIQQAEVQQLAAGEPVVSRNPFASRCYTMSESHLSGHRLIVGFEKLGDAQDAHEWVARQGRGDFTAIQQAEAQHPAAGDPVYQICKKDSHCISSAWIDVEKRAYEDAGMYPEYGRRTLYTHPAPIVPATTEPVGFTYQAEIAYADSTGGNGSFWRVPPDLDDEAVPLYTHPAPSVRADVVRVPLQVLKDASEALGNFVSDHGWGDADMQAMDNLDAYIARHEANRAAMLAAK